MSAKKIVNALLEADPKELAMRASEGPSLDASVVFQCPLTDVSGPPPHTAQPNYYSDEVGDWQLDWNQASRFRLGDYVQDGTLDLNDMPFGTESVILVNPDGSPGKEYSIEDLALALNVVDTYVSPNSDIEFGY